MSWVIYLVIAFAGMPVAAYALLGAWHGMQRLAEYRRTAPPVESVQQLEADLRRLRAELEDTENRPGLTAKGHRVRALRAAYLDALSAACLRLDVPPPPDADLMRGSDHVRLAEIYRAEEALRQRGLSVRDPVAG
ncbi:MAG: hypothetical protein JWM19_481 [Actinomycetia bacterium]|nr:hypothetical protein [Actinomycetes bacterium]